METPMSKRMNPFVRMDLIQPFIDYSNSGEEVGLEPIIKELVKIRASQINGCAVCLMLHTTEARRIGETEMRLYLLNGWREALHFSPRERAAIAWTEALTTLDRAGMDEAYAMIEAEFTEAERISLTLLIGAINTWNRINIGFEVSPPRSAEIAVAA
jgi:AhpD family alkylhydroperoxidase